MAALRIVVKDKTYQVQVQDLYLEFPAGEENRKVLILFLRSFKKYRGATHGLFTQAQIAEALPDFVGATKQSIQEHERHFAESGAQVLAYWTRKRTVDAAVVEAGQAEVSQAPLIATEELRQRVNHRLGRMDLSAANIEAALAQLSGADVRRVVRTQLAQGAAQYQESFLWEELLRTCEVPEGRYPGIEFPAAAEPRLVEPTAMRTLLTPGAPLAEVPTPRRWGGVLLALSYWGVPLSRLGQWVGVHKTTVWRWLQGLAAALWPTVAEWIGHRSRGGIVSVDEKWLKLRRRWWDWFVVVDAATDLPLVTSLSPTRSRWACRWVGVKLRRLGLAIKAVVTDGLAGYAALLPEGGQQLCVFHQQQGVTRWCREHLEASAQTAQCQQQMKRVVQTAEKRTGRRRLATLAEQADVLGIGDWLQQTMAKLPGLLPAIGSRRLPRTINGIERFFRTFTPFYKGRCGVHSVRSAKGELLLFVLVSVFTQRDTDGVAPIEAIVPEARQMPFYRLLNEPLAVLLGVDHVTRPSNMAMAQDALTDALAA